MKSPSLFILLLATLATCEPFNGPLVGLPDWGNKVSKFVRQIDRPAYCVLEKMRGCWLKDELCSIELRFHNCNTVKAVSNSKCLSKNVLCRKAKLESEITGFRTFEKGEYAAGI